MALALETLELLECKQVLVLRAHKNGHMGRMGRYNANKFYAKLDPDMEPPSQETHFDTLLCTSIFRGRTWKFSPSLVYANPCLNLNYSAVLTASPARLLVLLEHNVICYKLPKCPPHTLAFAGGGPWKRDNLHESHFRAHLYARQRALLCAGGQQMVRTGICRAI